MGTKIEWTHGDGMTGETWNPTTGCDKISAGCGLPRFEDDAEGGCYALALAKRLKGMGQAKYQNDGDPRTSGPGFGLTVHPDALEIPLRWKKPRLVFVNSMSDLGHARVPREFLAQVWAVMAMTPQHTYQILSKRPERMRSLLSSDPFRRLMYDALVALDYEWINEHRLTWPLPNVWLGTSIELDRYARRADELRETPAAVRFLSLEPLLGPLPSLDLTGIDWVIIGGESGPDSRRMDLGWARDLVARCRESGARPFVKQLGSIAGAEFAAGSKGGDFAMFPDDLKIRQFPNVGAGAMAS